MSRLPTFLAGVLAAVAIPVAAQQGMMLQPMFHDIESDAAFAQPVEQLVRMGIVRGYDNGNFGPHDPLTRSQIAILLDRYDKEVITPLRSQVEELRKNAGLGQCGDGIVQTGEACDDGNLQDDDGCSSACRLEQKTGGGESLGCPEGIEPGESFRAPDGCNTCLCGKDGLAACTKMACPTPPPGDRCQPYICPDGSRPPSCTDDGHVINYFADPCLSSRPVCGNGICEDGEDSVCPPCVGGGPCPMMPCRSGSCPQDCAIDDEEPEPLSCSDQKAAFNDLARQNAACISDADCMLFDASCPFITCGVAVNRSAKADLAAAADAYNTCIRTNNGPIMCASCIRQTVTCEAGRCVAKPG